MKPRTWLCLDGHFLCWRSYYTTGSLSYGDVVTGALFGFFRDLINFTNLHDTQNVMIAFDRKPYLRCKLLRSYKDRTAFEPEQENHAKVREQIGLLRDKLLKGLGYRNVFHQKGYEADDVIASFIRGLPSKDKAIIITSDHDLFQLLDHRTIVWNPNSKKAITAESFTKTYGVTPEQWIRVKAIAGCKSDNVRGVFGVGEAKACKYLNDFMKPDGVDLRKIQSATDLIEKNMAIVKLPFPGIKNFKPKKDELTRVAWKKMLKKYGMVSLLDRLPQGVK